MPPLWARWLKVYIAGGAIITTGVLLFKYTTPTDQQLLDSLSPELRAQYAKDKKMREWEQEELKKIVQKSLESDEPIWKAGGIESPMGQSHKMKENTFRKQIIEKEQQEQLSKANQQLDDIRRLENGNKKNSWWSFW